MQSVQHPYASKIPEEIQGYISSLMEIHGPDNYLGWLTVYDDSDYRKPSTKKTKIRVRHFKRIYTISSVDELPATRQRELVIDYLKYHELNRYSVCDLWLGNLNSDSTRTHYRTQMSQFCRFLKMTPDVIHKIGTEDGNYKMIRELVLKYLVNLKTKAKRYAGKAQMGSISVNSVGTMLAGPLSFFEYHDIAFTWKMLMKHLPERVENNLRAYSKEEIAKLLSFADHREKVLILVMASGGPRRGAFSTLKVKHVSVIDEMTNIGIMKVYAESADWKYVTLLTPEAMEAISEYIKWRASKGEKITPESPLVRDKFDVIAPKRANKPKPITDEAVYMAMRRLLTKAGMWGDETIQPDHSFRYFFNTTMMNSEVIKDFKELFMGHSIDLDDIYYKAETPESKRKILFEYMKAVDALTISDRPRLVKEISELKEKVKDMPKLEVMQTMLIQKDVEFENYKKKMEEDRQRDKDELKEEMRKEMEKLVVDRYVEGNGYQPAGDKASPTPPAAAAE